MKIKIDYVFPEQYRIIAEEYISYKRSMGFSFGYDDQKNAISFFIISTIILFLMM